MKNSFPERRLRSIFYPLGFAVVFVFAASGCVSKYAIKQDAAREEMLKGDFTKAAAVYLKDDKPTDYVDVLLNRGLAQFESHDYLSAENDLSRAYDRIDELYTKSISRGLLSIVSNDRALAYSGTNLERGMLHYYRGLGFLQEGKTEDFSIEARALSKYLTELPDLSKKSDVDFAFLRYFCGVGYDMASQPNDAWIAYERARALYPKQIGSTPTFLTDVSAISAKRSGVITADSAERSHIALPDSNSGRLVVFVESGVCAGLRQVDITIPFFETDQREYPDNFDYSGYGKKLMHRRYEQTTVRIVDWIHIAIPTVTHDGATRVSNVEISANGNRVGSTDLAAELSDAFERDFSDRLPAIIGRTFARTIAKRAGAEVARKESGDIGYWAARLLGEVTETADTRSWALLPDKIFVLDKYLPAGNYSLHITGSELNSQIDAIDLPAVKIEPGQITIQRVRLRG